MAASARDPAGRPASSRCARAADRHEPLPRTPAAPPRATPRVLVADDEESIREMLAKTLALADYEVHTVPDGQAAVDSLRAEAFDLLITDLSMPRLDGLAVVREARRLYPTTADRDHHRLFERGRPPSRRSTSGSPATSPSRSRSSKVLTVAAHALGEEP